MGRHHRVPAGEGSSREAVLPRGGYSRCVREPIYKYRLLDYDRAIIPSRFIAFLEEGVDAPSDWIPRTGRSLGHPGWGLIYHLALSVLDPEEFNLVVETGTNLGSTAIIVAQALKDSKRPGVVRTIEIDPEIAAEAERRFELSGVAQFVEPFVGDSLDRLPELVWGDSKLRMVFLDGNHFHDHVVSEFEIVEPHLAADGLVILDNTYLIAEDREDPRVNGALRTIVSRFGGNLINLPICSWYTPGIAIWQRQPFDSLDPPAPGSFDSSS